MCKEVVKQERGIRFRRGKWMEKPKAMHCERKRRHREDAEVEGNSKHLGNEAFIHRDFPPSILPIFSFHQHSFLAIMFLVPINNL